MNALLFASLLVILPTASRTQAETLPSLWNCVGETRVECTGRTCVAAPVVGTVQISFETWEYERCMEICVSGASTSWREDGYGNLFVMASDAPQHLILRPGDRFRDVASDRDHVVITEWRCFPALQSERTSRSILEVYDVFSARSPQIDPLGLGR